MLRGTTKRILFRFEVQLQGKTRRGVQSSQRHQRNVKIQRDNYVRKVCEHARQYFLDERNGFAPTVQALLVKHFWLGVVRSKRA